MATSVKKTVPMCCVTIGYEHYLLPADDGMRLVRLLQSAFECKQRYEDRGMQYEVGQQPERIVFEMVRPSQIVQPRGEGPEPIRCLPAPRRLPPGEIG